MPLHIPLDIFLTSAPPRHVAVELDEDGYVALVIPLRDREPYGWHKPADDLDEVEERLRLVCAGMHYLDTDNVRDGELLADPRRRQADAEKIEEELAALRRDLGREGAHDLVRHLTATDARALAAALIHFAEETDRAR